MSRPSQNTLDPELKLPVLVKNETEVTCELLFQIPPPIYVPILFPGVGEADIVQSTDFTFPFLLDIFIVALVEAFDVLVPDSWSPASLLSDILRTVVLFAASDPTTFQPYDEPPESLLKRILI